MAEYIIDRQLDITNGTYTIVKREEIVRCCDCKYIELQTVSYSVNPLYVCLAEWCEGSEGDNPLVVPFGFCAWGERR